MAQSDKPTETRSSLYDPDYLYRFNLPVPGPEDVLLALFLGTPKSPRPILQKFDGVRINPPCTEDVPDAKLKFFNFTRNLVVYGLERVLEPGPSEKGYDVWLVEGELVDGDGKRQRMRGRMRARYSGEIKLLESRPSFIEMPQRRDADSTEWNITSGPNALQLLNNMLDFGSTRDVAVHFGVSSRGTSTRPHHQEADVRVNVFGAYRADPTLDDDRWYLRGWCDADQRLPPAHADVDAKPDEKGRRFVEIGFSTRYRNRGTFRRCEAPDQD